MDKNRTWTKDQFKRRDAEAQRKKTLCNSVNLRVTLCNDFLTQSCTEKTQSYTEKKKPPNPRRGNKVMTMDNEQ
jgi:hypothetical protein